MELYLGQWEWADRDGTFQWRAPGGAAVGALDLRSTAQCGIAGGTPGYGLFVYSSPQTHPLLLRSLGTDLTARLNTPTRTHLQTALNSTTTLTDRLGDLLKQITQDSGCWDATGLGRWKPVQPTRAGLVSLTIGGLGTIYQERVTPAHPSFAAAIQVFQADYRTHRPTRDPILLRKWTGATLLKLFTRLNDLDADSLMPPEFRSDGYEAPTTSISDNFDRTNEELDAGPWVEIINASGDWDVVSNEAKLSGTPDNEQAARHTTALSTDDHEVQCDVTALKANPNGGYAGPCARISTDTHATRDYYFYLVKDAITDASEIGKMVDGTPTSLATGSFSAANLPETLKLTADGSDLTGLLNGSANIATTDTAITGNLNVGMVARREPDKIDNWSAADVAAATFYYGGVGLPLMGVQ